MSSLDAHLKALLADLTAELPEVTEKRMFGADAGALSAELIGPGPERDEVTMPDGGLTAFGGKAPPPTPEARPAVCPFTVMFLFSTLVLELLILLTVLFTYDLLIFVWFT